MQLLTTARVTPQLYPFRDPSVSPLTIYFCANTAKISIGTMATIEAADICPQLIEV